MGDRGLDLLALGFQLADSLADEGRVDAGLDRAELALDPLVDLAEPAHRTGPLGAVLALLFRRQGRALLAEVVEAIGAEDPAGEEGVDQSEQAVLAHVLPFAVAGRLGGLVAVGEPVAAGVVGAGLAVLALHPQRVVAGRAVDDPAQLVEALLLVAAAVPGLAGAARLHLGLHPFEVLLGDERLVALLGLDPVLGAAPHQRPLALLDGAEVEPAPVKAPGVDVVFEDRADRALGPLARGVALGIDVAGRGRAAGAVEVVGDLLVARAGEEEREHLPDHGRLLGIGDEPRLLVPGLGPARVGVGLVPQAIAVRCPPAVAVALLRVLGLPAPDLAAELLDLELVERLEHVADQPPLRAGLVARAARVEDLHPGPGQLALVGEGVEEVAAEPRGRVDDHRVEAPRVGLLGLADQLAPTGPVVAPPGLLVGEVADDPPAQLLGLLGALAALRGKGDRRILLVLGR